MRCLLPAQDQPGWLQQLLHGAPARAPSPDLPEGSQDQDAVSSLMRSPLSAALMPLVAAAGAGQPLLPHMLAGAAWHRLAAVMRAEEGASGGGAPWLLLPLMLAPAVVAAHEAADVGNRLMHAASLLSQAAVLGGSAQAAHCAAGAAGSLLLLSICEGQATQLQQQQQRRRQAASDAATQEEEDMRRALAMSKREHEEQQAGAAEDAELQRVLQLSLLEAGGGSAAAAEATAAEAEPAVEPGGQGAQAPTAGQQEAEQPAPELPLVEVRGCWSLSCDQHVALMQHALLPLAASKSSLPSGASLQPDQCLAELASAAQHSGSDAGFYKWRAPALAELKEAASTAAAFAAAAPPPPAAAAEEASSAAAASLVALLLPFVRPPVTLLTAEPLPFRSGDLPLDTEAALYVSVAPDSAEGGRQPQRPLRALHQTLTALLPGAEARRRAQHAAELGLGGSINAHVIKSQLSIAVQVRPGQLLLLSFLAVRPSAFKQRFTLLLQDACKQPSGGPLSSCLLRTLYACPTLHTCAEAMALSEGLLRFLAAPEQDGGPLGQGAASSAARQQPQRPESAASVRSGERRPWAFSVGSRSDRCSWHSRERLSHACQHYPFSLCRFLSMQSQLS